MKPKIRVAFLFLLLSIFPFVSPARSDLLFDQTPTGSNLYYRCTWDSVRSETVKIADNFKVPFTANVDSVVWWGGYWPLDSGDVVDFWIEIYPDSAFFNQPQQNPIYSERVSFTETNIPPPSSYYLYEAIIPPFPADSGVTYWIEFMATLVWPPSYWGNNGSTNWGDGQEFYFKSSYFGYPQWASATTVFGDPLETSFQIHGQMAGIEEEKRQNRSKANFEITISPNPFKSVARFELPGARKEKTINLEIYDASGRLVKSVKLATSTYQLGADLFPGIYFLKAGGKPAGKVVKVR